MCPYAGRFNESQIARQGDDFRRFWNCREAKAGTDFSFVYAAIPS